jgi:hypothetical protein
MTQAIELPAAESAEHALLLADQYEETESELAAAWFRWLGCNFDSTTKITWRSREACSFGCRTFVRCVMSENYLTPYLCQDSRDK